MDLISLFFSRYVRHALTVGTGILVHKGWVDSETAGAAVDATVNFGAAIVTGGTALLLSKLSDKLKLF